MIAARLRAWRNSTTLRFVALYLFATASSGVIVFGFVYRASERLIGQEFRQIVAADRAEIGASYARGGEAAAAALVRERMLGDPDRVYLLARPDGTAAAGNLGSWPPTLGPGEQWRIMRLYRTDLPDAQEIGLETVTLAGGWRLAAGRSMSDVDRLRRSLEGSLTGALLIGLPLGLAGAALLVYFVNGRVRQVADVAAQVGQGDFAQRIETFGTHDPFDRLGRALNDMFGRIETLVRELTTLSDSLAHDLRSPLTRIRARAESALGASRTPQVQANLQALLGETDRMLKMLSDTLQVSRAEAGIGRERFEAVELGALIDDLADMYGPAAEDAGATLAAQAPTAPTPVMGNRQLLAQAVANLIENALRYGADGGTIRLSLEPRAERVRLVVADRGPGIAPEHRDEALKRFGRLDPARSKEGSGLGLALVGAVARLHGGRVALEDNQPGLRAVIELPAA
jgi:signal transduction histidine kinase